MRGNMNQIKFFLAGALVGAVMVGMAGAAQITGPQDGASLAATLNQVLMNWMGYTNDGELQLLGSNAFAPLGTVATGMTSLGPVGSHETVQRWMVVVSPSGTVGFVPVF